MRKSRSPSISLVVRGAATLAAALVSAPLRAGTSQVPTGDTNSLRPAGQDIPTISATGSTALKNWIIGSGSTLLNNADGLNTIVLGSGSATSGEVTYTAPLGNTVSYQLGAKSLGGDTDPTQSIVTQSALRLEYHEAGSAEGVLELIDSQINNGIITDKSYYNPSSTQGVYVNNTANKWGGVNPSGPTPPATVNGWFLDANTSAQRAAQAQSPANLAYSDVASAQTLSYGGGKANPFATPGTPGYGKGNPLLVSAGGNAASGGLDVFARGGSYALPDQSIANMTAGAANPTYNAASPRSGPSATYGTGDWNTAGRLNLVDHTIAQSATNFVANPGTGLEHLNRSDAQWLQTTGRLQNGATFQVTTRDLGSGTRNVAANNTGVDPSWAVGVNDDGNGNSPTGGTDQVNITPNGTIRFSNKTSGGAGLRPTVQNARMAIGTLSISDTGANAKNGAANPLRVLAYRNDANDVADNSNGAAFKNFGEDASGNLTVTPGDTASHQFVMPSAASITNGSYAIWQNETMVTVKVPDAVAYGRDVIKGDNGTTLTYDAQGNDVGTGHDVRDYRDNILNSTAKSVFNPQSSVANPADSLIQNGFAVSGAMLVAKSVDGPSTASANPAYDPNIRSQFLTFASNIAAFNPANPSTVFNGTGAVYGGANQTLSGQPKVVVQTGTGDQINITASNPDSTGRYSGGNWLFGNFNQNGIRDFNSLKVGEAALETLWNTAADHSTSAFVGSAANGSANASKLDFSKAPSLPAGVSLAGLQTMTGQDGTTGATKGDLIVMGDYNGDGAFNGKDLYQMAVGASLADSTSTDRLTLQKLPDGYQEVFGDAARRGVLMKNAALDYLQTATGGATFDGSGQPTNAAAYIRQTASQNTANDPRGTNAFNRFDVNGDGKIDLKDARIINAFYGKDYTNLSDQLAATVGTDGDVHTGAPQQPISLVTVSQIDGSGRTHLSVPGNGYAISGDDFQDFLKHNPGLVIPGDATLDGKVDVVDLGVLATNFGRTDTSQWGAGDFNGDGKIDVVDLGILATNFGKGSGLTPAESHAEFAADLAMFPSLEQAYASVPEPGTIGLMLAAGGALLARRRR